jgi:hypothetical protein
MRVGSYTTDTVYTVNHVSRAGNLSVCSDPSVDVAC